MGEQKMVEESSRVKHIYYIVDAREHPELRWSARQERDIREGVRTVRGSGKWKSFGLQASKTTGCQWLKQSTGGISHSTVISVKGTISDKVCH
jgi:hypothetical protein